MKLGGRGDLRGPGRTWGRRKTINKIYHMKQCKKIKRKKKKKKTHTLYVTTDDINVAVK